MPGKVHRFGDENRPTLVFEDPDDVSDPVLSFYLRYWHAKRAARELPLVSDFKASEVRKNLRWAVVADVLPEIQDFRYRVVGSAVCEYFLGDGTGKTVTEAFAGLDTVIGWVKWLYQRVCFLRRPIRCVGSASIQGDTYFPQYDSLYLPFSKDGRDVDRLINCFTFSQESMRAKRPERPGI